MYVLSSATEERIPVLFLVNLKTKCLLLCLYYKIDNLVMI